MRCAAVLLLLATAAEAASISGTVYLREGQARRPLSGVEVQARAAGGRELVQRCATDAEGRYRLTDLQRARVSLTAVKRGYFARAAASGDAALVLDAAAEDVSGADFELHAGGVITGRVLDQWGGPVESALVSLYRVAHPGSPERTYVAVFRTDDRGIYRAFGLEPGRYILLARPTATLGDAPAPVYYPGVTDPARAREIEIAAGSETAGIDVSARPGPTFRIAGKVVGAPEKSTLFVMLMAAEGEQRDRLTIGVAVKPDGSFITQGFPPGAYIVSATARPSNAPGQSMARQLVDLRADVTDLVLQPMRLGRIEGRVVLSGIRAGGREPAELNLRAADPARFQNAAVSARAPDYRFEFANLWPGNYAIEVVSPPGAYLKSIRQGSTRLPRSEIAVPEGGLVAVELDVGVDLGIVTGLVKAPGGSHPLPHARVALARPGTSPVEFRWVQADQKGRFVFTDVRPGEYMIGAWSRLEASALYQPGSWQRAKRFPVEAASEIDLELTAAP